MGIEIVKFARRSWEMAPKREASTSGAVKNFSRIPRGKLSKSGSILYPHLVDSWAAFTCYCYFGATHLYSLFIDSVLLFDD